MTLGNIRCSRRETGAAGFNHPLTPAIPRQWPTVLPLGLYCLIIFYFSSQPRFFIQPPEFFSSDKLYHFLEYALLGILAGRVIRANGLDFKGLSPVGAVAFFCLIYGAGDEFHQWFVPGRWATVGDVLADAAGGWAGGGLYFMGVGKSRSSRSARPSPRNT